MYRTYVPKQFSRTHQLIIANAVLICHEWAAQGYTLTLRQLYYQFVSRGLIPNNQQEYKRLGTVINDARLAGEIDWDHLEDRTRNVKRNPHWSSPAEVMQSAANSFRIDRWARQSNYVEVWIEKDALVGVIEGVCRQFDVPFFSCRGYTSQSEMWAASQRIVEKTTETEYGRDAVILHLGDHDPSGIDMSRDIEKRLELFCRVDGANPPEVRRIALNMDQVRALNAPPNPTKLSDSRSTSYVAEYGLDSWELDALPPSAIVTLIENELEDLIDWPIWQDDEETEGKGQMQLAEVARRWSDVVALVG